MNRVIIAIIAVVLYLSISPISNAAELTYSTEKQQYQERDISIEYPVINGLQDGHVQSIANSAIAAEALRILQEYTEAELQDLTLNLKYEIKLQSPDFISIAYTGDRYLKGTMYPVKLFFTTNINLQDGSRLRLSDLFSVDGQFANKLKKGRLQAVAPELTIDRLDFTDDRLLQAFSQSDALQGENPDSVYSYFTSSGIGVSIGVSHALGDYVIFEADYPDVRPHLLAGAATSIAGLPCDCRQKPAASQSLADYFPFKAGRVWVYDGEGMEYAAFTRRVMFQQDNRVQIVDDNGGSRVIRGFAIDAAAVRQIFTLPETDSEQNWLSKPETESSILLKAPLTVGAVWQDERHRREIISVSETVTSPAGTFSNVVKVKITALTQNQDWQMFEYYAAGVGLVMREFVTADNYIVRSKLRTIIR